MIKTELNNILEKTRYARIKNELHLLTVDSLLKLKRDIDERIDVIQREIFGEGK